MPGDYDDDLLRDLEIAQGRTEEWKENMFERVAKAEKALEQIPEIQKTITKSEVRLSIVIGILIFAANWLFKH